MLIRIARLYDCGCEYDANLGHWDFEDLDKFPTLDYLFKIYKDHCKPTHPVEVAILTKDHILTFESVYHNRLNEWKYELKDEAAMKGLVW